MAAKSCRTEWVCLAEDGHALLGKT